MSKPTPKAALKQLEERDGHECSWHGLSCGTDVLVPQHRQGGMGGSKTKHRMSNLVWLCSLINGLIESDAGLAEEARRRGIKVPFWDATTSVPVLYADGRMFYLDDDGGRDEMDTTPI